MRSHTYCLAGLFLFAALSITDLVQTYALLQTSGGVVYEGNPVARAWLTAYGWRGLIAFKAASLFVVVAAVALLARRRPGVAVGVVAFACLAMILVTLYSRGLLTG